MVDRVHGYAANGRPPTQPSASSRLSERDAFMFNIAHLADCGIAILEDQSDFTRGKFNMCIFPFLRHQLAIGSSAPDDLSTFPHLQLDIMDERPRRDISEWKGITRFDICRGARDHPVSDAQPEGCQDISFLSIGIVKQRDPSRSIRIVFNGRHLGRDLSLVPLEINESISSFMASSSMP
jgi:hypothetical protein